MWEKERENFQVLTFERRLQWGQLLQSCRQGLSGIMGDYLFLNKNPIKKIIINTSSSIYKEEMRKQNQPIELFIVTNFILMKSTRFHYSGLGHNLCYKETSAVTKFAIMRSAPWRIQGQRRGYACRLGAGPGRGWPRGCRTKVSCVPHLKANAWKSCTHVHAMHMHTTMHIFTRKHHCEPIYMPMYTCTTTYTDMHTYPMHTCAGAHKNPPCIICIHMPICIHTH